MAITEPTFAGVPLSLYRQLPRGVTVTLAGAGGQAPIIGLTDPSTLLPTTTTNNLQQQISLKGSPTPTTLTGDTFTPTNTLFGANNLELPTGGEEPTTMPPPKGGGKKGGKKAKGMGQGGPGGGGPPGLQKKGGIPPGLAKKAETGQSLPPGNPWSNLLQTQGQNQPNALPQSIPGQGGQPKPLSLPQGGTTGTFNPLNLISQPTTTPNIPGLPGPTMTLSSEPGPILQLGPPFA